MNPVAFITGGATRVGKGIVEHLAECGYDLFFTYHASGDSANEMIRRLSSPTRRVVAAQADLTQPHATVKPLFEHFNRSFDRLDLLVHNASLYTESPLESVDLELSRTLMAIHYESPLLLTHAAAPLLRESRGTVVAMCDLLTERPWPKYLAYAASKGALRTLILGLSRALAPEVTVNGIAPGVVDWPEDYPQSERDKYLQRVPLRRSGTPSDVAALVHFLATTGKYITGQIIPLDGGRSVT